MLLEVPGFKGTKLIIGTLFARGRRTEAAVTHQMGLHEAPTFSRYHYVLNISRHLLHVLVRTLVAVGRELPSSSIRPWNGARCSVVAWVGITVIRSCRVKLA
jgi:hypothetical protein